MLGSSYAVVVSLHDVFDACSLTMLLANIRLQSSRVDGVICCTLRPETPLTDPEELNVATNVLDC